MLHRKRLTATISAHATFKCFRYLVLGLFALIVAIVGAAPVFVTADADKTSLVYKFFSAFNNDIHTKFGELAMVCVFIHVMTWKKAVGSVSSSVCFTFAFSEATAAALTASGAVDLVAVKAEQIAGRDAHVLMMSLLFGVMVFLTNFINNNTVSLLLFDTVFGICEKCGMWPKPLFAVVVAGSSAAFMTPIGTACNTLVVGPGKYTFADFVKCGWPITLSSWVVSIACAYVWSESINSSYRTTSPK